LNIKLTSIIMDKYIIKQDIMWYTQTAIKDVNLYCLTFAIDDFRCIISLWNCFILLGVELSLIGLILEWLVFSLTSNFSRSIIKHGVVCTAGL